MRFASIAEPRRRSLAITLLTLGNLACLASIAHTLHRHGKLYPSYPLELAAGIARYGIAGIFDDPAIGPVSLKTERED